MKKTRHNFTFIDLFAGIGGFHQAMRYLGGKCVMASEIDAACVKTYKINFPDVEIRGDIRKIKPQDIPAFDVLCAGFPCQPFSKAGYRDGFQDKRGTLFHSILKQSSLFWKMCETSLTTRSIGMLFKQN